VGTDAEWNNEARVRLRGNSQQRLDDAAVEVIVVIVRRNDRVERRQLLERQRWRMKASRSDQRGRRRTSRPHRIEKNPRAVDLDEHRRMAEPGRAQSRRGRLLEIGTGQ
jgi:hypothetical protein